MKELNDIASFQPENCVISEGLENILYSQENSIYWKDKSGKYLGVNQHFLETSKLKYSDIVGSRDFDLNWHHLAHDLNNNDQEIIKSGRIKIFLESVNSIGNCVDLFISCKRPLRSRSGKIIGIFGQSIIHTCTGSSLNLTVNLINQMINHSEEEPHLYNLAFLEINNGKKDNTHGLSKRQLQCLQLIVRGYTSKEIAIMLKLSYRTIEFYVKIIKNKLNCKSRSELIAKALTLMDNIPLLSI